LAWGHDKYNKKNKNINKNANGILFPMPTEYLVGNSVSILQY
jgi:hypothetical protein